MSNHIRTVLFATALLTGTFALTSVAHAQAVSTPGTDQAQTSTSAIQKAQSFNANQPNMSLPNKALTTNPHTIAEQPDQPAPSAPSAMTGTNATGPVPSAQKSKPRIVGTRSRHHHGKSAAQNPTNTPQ